ncbi:hypothetical protein SeLEV6574_g02941 [Synchytrium endobioticum]|uniref:Chromo domain-containing protein n=1 Tax=Synchytrium endobioticum TaxID=286115 RepID=A0A507D6C3_9FUNG|nr:hypothetical protein SeLEV6574_g02941 [Synchytrium endobioticum]
MEHLGMEGEVMINSRVPEATKLKGHFDTIYKHLQYHLEKARDLHKYNADKHRTSQPTYNLGDEVMLSTKNIRTERSTKKLDYKWIGPYYIKRQINPVTYELELPSNMRIHDVFHTSLLKRYIRPTDFSKQLPKPPPIRIAEEDGFIIKDILDVRRRGKGFEYLISWEGYTQDDNTWEPRRSCHIVTFVLSRDNTSIKGILSGLYEKLQGFVCFSATVKTLAYYVYIPIIISDTFYR